MTVKLGYLQQQMLDFCRKHPGRHYLATDHETIRVARSLERRGLIRLTDCGMCSAAGRPVYMAQAAKSIH